MSKTPLRADDEARTNAGASNAKRGGVSSSSSSASSAPSGPEIEPDSDIDLMLRSQRDEIEAFEALVRRHERSIYYYFYRMSGDRIAAEDYAQDVFIRLWTNRHLYKPIGRFTNYLFQIARNHWINEYKRRRIRPTGAPIEIAAPFASDDRVDEQPLAALENKELGNHISAALSAIPDEQREVFILSRFQKMKYQEIADLLDIPVRTVESRLVLATRKLMGKLESYMRVEKET